MRVGLMGGTFDPIHYGHLVAAEGVRHAVSLDRVFFVPAARPPHKVGRPITEARHRYTMALLATLSHPAFAVSTVELDRPGPSYTIDTLAAFRQAWGEGVELYFITGADALLEILHWRAPEELLAAARFVAATRPGYSQQGLDAVRERLPEPLRARLTTLEVPALAIASSDLRRRVREGHPIKYLVPELVEDYIIKEGLYR